MPRAWKVFAKYARDRLHPTSVHSCGAAPTPTAKNDIGFVQFKFLSKLSLIPWGGVRFVIECYERTSIPNNAEPLSSRITRKAFGRALRRLPHPRLLGVQARRRVELGGSGMLALVAVIAAEMSLFDTVANGMNGSSQAQG